MVLGRVIAALSATPLTVCKAPCYDNDCARMRFEVLSIMVKALCYKQEGRGFDT
jgi:hypothetical protein